MSFFRRSIRLSVLPVVLALSLVGGEALAKKHKQKAKPDRQPATRTTVVVDAGCEKSCQTHHSSCEGGSADEQALRRCVNRFNDCIGACSKTVTEVVK